MNYGGDRWRQLRKWKLENDPHCQRCGSSKGRMDVHHLEPVSEGGPEYPPLSGLETRCISCHSMETTGVTESEQDRRIAWREFINS